MNKKTAKSKPTNSPRGKESIRTWLRILSCESQIERRLRARFREHFPVTLPQFDVLSELERAGEPLTMSRLSRELMVSNGNITGVIDRLEKTGFVRRERSQHDRRVQMIRLTDSGNREFKRMARQHERWLADLFDGLTLENMRELQRLLLKLRGTVTAD